MDAARPDDGQTMPRVTEAPRSPETSRPRHWILRLSVQLGIVLLIGGVVVLLAARWDGWVGARREQTTDDAYVKGDITALSAKVEGYVRTVAVDDFQQVKAG